MLEDSVSILPLAYSEEELEQSSLSVSPLTRGH